MADFPYSGILLQTKDSFNYTCAEIQKADGTSHPLLKLSLLNFVKLRLESEVQFGEDGFSIFAVFFAFKVVVVNYCNDVFSNCPACTNIPAFVALVKNTGTINILFDTISIFFISSCNKTICCRTEVSISRLVEVAYMQAIGTRFVSRSAFPCKVCPPAVFIGIEVIFVAAHIFSSKGEVLSKVVVETYIPDFFIYIISTICSSINFCMTGSVGFKICSISVYCTKVCFNTGNIETVFGIKQIINIVILMACTFSSQTKYFYFVAVGNFYAIQIGIKYITGEENFVPTAGLYIKTTKAAIQVSTVKNYIFIAFFIAEVLGVLEHTGVGPVFVNLAGYPKTGTESSAVAINVTAEVFVRKTSLTGDFYVVSFFLKVSNANAEAVEFVSKFSS